MASLIFNDPQSGEEIEFNRTADNPFYNTIDAFSKSAPSSLCFLSDGATQVARTAYTIPSECPLPVVPAIKLEIVQSAKGHDYEVRGWTGFFDTSFSDKYDAKFDLKQDWIGEVWKQHLCPLLFDDLYYSYLNYCREKKWPLPEFDSNGELSGPLDFMPMPTRQEEYEESLMPPHEREKLWRAGHSGRSDPNQDEIPHLLYLKVCLGWNHWENEGVSFLARTMEAIAMGICRSMSEDNFRKICIKAGLLVPTRRIGGPIRKQGQDRAQSSSRRNAGS